MSTCGTQLTHNEKVAIAVVFLTDVSPIKYKEVDLRKYLASKRGLTIAQINDAFRIYRENMASEKKRSENAGLSVEPRSQFFSGRRSQPHQVEVTRTENSHSGKANSEKSVDRKRKIPIPSVGILIQSKQEDGYNLLLNFLDAEREYCSILQCLEEVYYKCLIVLEEKGKIRLSRKELDEIFGRIPNLLKFHRVFYDAMHQGRDIGQLFVANFSFFKGYIEYMKACKNTIDIMRRYLLDRTIHKHLASLRQQSGRKKDDVVGLLLVPLQRILEYKIFLDKLSGWVDKTQTDNSNALSKATRRIGRVASYTEKYKYAIANRHEMNKVQQYLQRQCFIISPSRVIIRRGIMIRRTTGWKARNKTYFFFLFNDILLWTTKRRELQNIIQLEDSEVMPSDSKTDVERKFKIVTTGQKNKTLLLECTSKRQRNEWYIAVKKAIAGAKAIDTGELTKSDSLPKQDWDNWLEGARNKVGEETLQPAELDLKEDEPGDETDSSKKEPDEHVSYDEDIARFDSYYEESCNFQNENLKDFDPYDDSVSQMSEVDHEEWFSIGHVGLTPVVKKSTGSSVEYNYSRYIESSDTIEDDQSQIPIQRRDVGSRNLPLEGKQNRIQKLRGDKNYEPGKTSIIRRHTKDHSVTREQRPNSSFVVRLNDL